MAIVTGQQATAADVLAVVTKEFFIPVTRSTDTLGLYGDYPVANLDDADDVALIAFHVPSNFVSIAEAVIICLWNASHADTDLDIYSDYATAGEAYNANSESDEATTYSFTADQLLEINISGILSSLAADDYAGIRIKLGTDPGDTLKIIGVRFKYANV